MKQRLEKRQMRGLALEVECEAFNSVGEQGDFRNFARCRLEFEVIFEQVRGDKVGDVGVLARLRPKHDAIDVVAADGDRSVADLKKERAFGGENRGTECCGQVTQLATVRVGSGSQLFSDGFAPSEDIVELQLAKVPVRLKVSCGALGNRFASQRRTNVTPCGTACTVGNAGKDCLCSPVTATVMQDANQVAILTDRTVGRVRRPLQALSNVFPQSRRSLSDLSPTKWTRSRIGERHFIAGRAARDHLLRVGEPAEQLGKLEPLQPEWFADAEFF